MRQRRVRRDQQLLALALEPHPERPPAELAARLCPLLGRSLHRRLRQLGRHLGGVPGGADAPRDRQRLARAAGLLPPTGFVSGGFFADDEFNGGAVDNYGQQQFFTRNSNIDSWSNEVWNQVFLGDNGAPATQLRGGHSQYTTLPTHARLRGGAVPLHRDGTGATRCSSPAVRHDSSGPSYAAGQLPDSRSDSRSSSRSPSTSVADQLRARSGQGPAPHPRRL